MFSTTTESKPTASGWLDHAWSYTKGAATKAWSYTKQAATHIPGFIYTAARVGGQVFSAQKLAGYILEMEDSTAAAATPLGIGLMTVSIIGPSLATLVTRHISLTYGSKPKKSDNPATWSHPAGEPTGSYHVGYKVSQLMMSIYGTSLIFFSYQSANSFLPPKEPISTDNPASIANEVGFHTMACIFTGANVAILVAYQNPRVRLYFPKLFTEKGIFKLNILDHITSLYAGALAGISAYFSFYYLFPALQHRTHAPLNNEGLEMGAGITLASSCLFYAYMMTSGAIYQQKILSEKRKARKDNRADIEQFLHSLKDEMLGEPSKITLTKDFLQNPTIEKLLKDNITKLLEDPSTKNPLKIKMIKELLEDLIIDEPLKDKIEKLLEDYTIEKPLKDKMIDELLKEMTLKELLEYLHCFKVLNIPIRVAGLGLSDLCSAGSTFVSCATLPRTLKLSTALDYHPAMMAFGAVSAGFIFRSLFEQGRESYKVALETLVAKELKKKSDTLRLNAVTVDPVPEVKEDFELPPHSALDTHIKHSNAIDIPRVSHHGYIVLANAPEEFDGEDPVIKPRGPREQSALDLASSPAEDWNLYSSSHRNTLFSAKKPHQISSARQLTQDAKEDTTDLEVGSIFAFTY